MVKHLLVSALLFSSALLCYADEGKDKEAAEKVISRFTKGSILPIKLTKVKKENNCDWFETKVVNGTLEVRGSSGVAMCRGFYDYLKRQNYGIQSWTGNRFAIPSSLPDQSEYKVVSQVPYHYYLNVVTYGYTMPYWDWNRWEMEIDWMAMHGINMPLALVANEAILARVWKKLGLTDNEIASYFVGPAHLPWMRMGNISKIDGPLPSEWHSDQVDLQHKILDRMRSLGMHPICSGFAGFVPQSLKRLYPNIKLVETTWAGAFHNWMLDPNEPLFQKIGKMFIVEWEKEFGRNQFYLVDSFNEMEIPFPPKEDPRRYSLLASYGNVIYQSIKAGNKDAVWVMQGWMFGYQRDIWDPETLKALLSKVPDNKLMLLDLAADYNHCFWKNGYSWELYKGFFNKPWVYSVIPNMGGKSGMTGSLEFYANGQWDALNSKNKGQLVGVGMAPEGIENNEVIYELLSDAGWSNAKIDLNSWLSNYSKCRYGSFPDGMKTFWDDMLQSVYGTFTDHPRYSWQFRPGLVARGSINANDSFYKGIEALAEVAPQMVSSQLFEYDFREWTAAYLGGKMENLVQNIEDAYSIGDTTSARGQVEQFFRLMLATDRLLVNHPTKDFQRWIDFARMHGKNTEQADCYERNARRIVTVWGPPIEDYSARIWAGLIRDYYLPRWQYYYEQKNSGKKFDFAAWELAWVEQRKGLSKPDTASNIIEKAVKLINESSTIQCQKSSSSEIVGRWLPQDISDEWRDLEWSIPVVKVKQLKAIKIEKVTGGQPLLISSLSLTLDGIIVAMDVANKEVDPTCFYPLSIPSDAKGNNSSLLRIRVKSKGTPCSSGILTLILKDSNNGN